MITHINRFLIELIWANDFTISERAGSSHRFGSGKSIASTVSIASLDCLNYVKGHILFVACIFILSFCYPFDIGLCT